jgi:hypothetical protein
MAGLVVAIVSIGMAGSFVRQSAAEEAPAEEPDLRATFEEHYAAFKAHCDKLLVSSDVMQRLDSPHFQAIVDMGPIAVPWIIEKRRQDPGFDWIEWACNRISRVTLNPAVYPWTKESLLEWWQGGQKQATARFGSVYEKWREAEARGDTKEAEKQWRTMRAIGVAALPAIMERVKGGDEKLLPMVTELTRGTANVSGKTAQERTAACNTWWGTHRKDWLIPFPDQVPENKPPMQ